MDRTVISWTPENWLTVTLMTWTGMLVLAILVHLVFRAKGGANNNG